MANTPEEVADIVAAATKAGVKGCVCFEARYSSQFLATKAVIDEGLLGHLHYGEVDYYHGIGPWYGQFRWNTGKKDGGSALLTAGCHALDALDKGQDMPLTSLREAKRTFGAVFAADKSAAAGGAPVSVG